MATQRGDALPVGYILERYRIDGILGDGGFGITYIATHTLMQKQVAIKELFPSMFALRAEGATVIPRGGNDGDAFQKTLASFLDEAKVLTLFSEHPNIVTVLDFFEANGTAYLIMQYEVGQTLSKWICGNPTPNESQLFDIFIPILDGLREIHAHNHLHRDIKPENIYIRSDGRPMLIDFGAARQVIGQQSNNLSVVLTDGYAPNEQYSLRGKQGAWTDIYSVGATIWSAINKGVVPLSAPERIDAHINQEADPLISASALGSGRYSSSFLDAIDWALTTVAPKRPQTIRQFQEVLLQKNVEQKHTSSNSQEIPFSSNEGQQKARQAIIQNHKSTKLIIGILIMALVIIGFSLWWTNNQKVEELKVQQEKVKIEQQRANDAFSRAESERRQLEEQAIKEETAAKRRLKEQAKAEASLKQEADRLAAERKAREQTDRIIEQWDLAWVGKKIFVNEASANIEKLIHWNSNEDFVSLGIGHFIWYPEGRVGQYKEMFPKLVQYLDNNNVTIPQWLSEQVKYGALWNSKSDLEQSRYNSKTDELKNLLIDTQDLQVAFMAERLTNALPNMLNAVSASEKGAIIGRYKAIQNSPRGFYPLLDYVHFKGEGTSISERYNGQGWGLLQVLQEMNTVSSGSEALIEFTRAAGVVLERRVRNAPAGKNEERWLNGWKKRLQSYLGG